MSLLINLLQGTAKEGRCGCSMAERHGGRGSHLRHCMDERHVLLQLPLGDTGDAAGHRQRHAVDHRHRLLPRLRAHQLAGRRGSGHAAAGILARHRGMDTALLTATKQ